MASQTTVLTSGGMATPIGRLELAGELVDAEPVMPSGLRVLSSFVLTVVTGGRGTYRHADGREEPIEPGAITLIRPHEPHWYGTPRGGRWSELFAVFAGPLFDNLVDAEMLPPAGSRHVDPMPSTAVLRSLLAASPRSRRATERQLLSLFDWLLDIAEPTSDGRSEPIARAADRLAADVSARVDVRALATEISLPYNTFRRRFTVEVGQAPRAYRDGHRLQTAATLLRVTNLTLRTIAEVLGFTDEFHLSRRFKAHVGQSPRDYRSGGTVG